MSTVPGNPALPAPLAPAMHPGDRDTHLDLDDLIDHSHEATQQASAGAQHPTRRWKRGVGRKSKTRKPRNPDAVMPLADHLVEFRKRFVRAIAGIIIMCDGQNVHECTDSEQMVALLQSGRAVFGVSVGSLWHQIKEALEHEEYVDLTKTPASTDTNRPIDDIAAIRMRKKLESRRKSRAAA